MCNKVYYRDSVSIHVKVDTSIVLESHPQVYEPSDDSYLLLDSVEVREGQDVLEIGTGGGLIALHCAKVANVTATDINPLAIALAKRNADMNRLKVDFINCDLFDGIRGSFDVIIFNPPYLQTEDERERSREWLESAWDGGNTGEQVVLEFLLNVKDLMNPEAKVYLLLSMNNRRAREYIGKYFESKQLAKMELFFETIVVFELTE
jgi:release factor glutamine methyltransferase